MITKYIINVHLEFDTQASRDTVYNKLKTAMTSAKVTDTWTNGIISKDESIRQENTQEVV